MFSKEVYVNRRRTLLGKMGETAAEGKRGIAVFIGNAEAPAQYKDNCYKWRQDSSWLYFWGLDEPMYAAVLDLDSGAETIFADDQEIDDIVWSGPLPSVKTLAAQVGVSGSAPYRELDNVVSKAFAQ
jgi:Xaa-Pro aminopeptidase